MVSLSHGVQVRAEAQDDREPPGDDQIRWSARLIAALARRPPPWTVSYGLIPVIVGLSALLGMALGLERTPYAAFVPAVFLIGLAFGLGQALATVGLSAVAGLLILADPGLRAPLTASLLFSPAVFMVIFGLISALLNAAREGALDQALRVEAYRTLHAKALAASRALRESEEALRELNVTLEQKVAQRTAELDAAREALRQAQKMEALGGLAGGLAHDFNNLLGGIIGGLDLARSRLPADTPQPVVAHLDVAADFAERAAGLTRRLLAFARREALNPERLDLAELAQGLREALVQTLGPTIQLEIQAADGVWPVRADRSEVENALLNLSINARDAMSGGGRLTIAVGGAALLGQEALGLALQPGHYTLLKVSDTGCGMPPEVAARAFEPFFTTKPGGKGTGLGLAAVYGFARRSGGQATLTSTVGEGTTITIYLPRD